jgi:hypothetical protein
MVEHKRKKKIASFVDLEISFDDSSMKSADLDPSSHSYKNINESIDSSSKSLHLFSIMNIEEALIKAGGYGKAMNSYN